VDGDLPGTFKVAGPDLVKLLLIGLIIAIHWLAFFGAGRIANPLPAWLDLQPVHYGLL